MPLIVIHGDRDRTVAAVNADKLISCRRAAGDITTREGPIETVDGTGRSSGRILYMTGNGTPVAESWIVHGGGHAWYRGSPAGSYTDPEGPRRVGRDDAVLPPAPVDFVGDEHHRMPVTAQRE